MVGVSRIYTSTHTHISISGILMVITTHMGGRPIKQHPHRVIIAIVKKEQVKHMEPRFQMNMLDVASVVM